MVYLKPKQKHDAPWRNKFPKGHEQGHAEKGHKDNIPYRRKSYEGCQLLE